MKAHLKGQSPQGLVLPARLFATSLPSQNLRALCLFTLTPAEQDPATSGRVIASGPGVSLAWSEDRRLPEEGIEQWLHRHGH
jgi:hypothetical protein